MSELRAKQKAKRREMIELAAGKLFEARGFTDTTIEEIAEQALVSPATVYNYYGNKNELLLALVAKGETATREKLQEFVHRAENEDPVELIGDIICFNVQDTLKYMSRELWGHVVAYVATTPDHSVAPRYLAAIADDLAAAISASLEKYMAMGKITKIDTEHFSYIMTRIERSHFLTFVYLHEMSVQDLLGGIKKDVAQLIEVIKK